MYFQINANLLDACVLGLLHSEDQYGYSLTQNLQEVVEISDSTTYPVLRRLKKDGYLDTYDQPYQGRNRRYYAITDKGKERHAENIVAWDEHKDKIDGILKGGATNE